MSNSEGQSVDRPIYKQTWFVVSMGILGFLLLATAMGDNTPTSSTSGSVTAQGATSSASSSSRASVRPVGTVGAPISDGKFQFVVNSVQCGAKQVGSGFLVEKAQGQFCIVNLTVRNTGDQSQTLYGSNQYLYNAAGQKYEANTAAAMKMGDSKSFIEGINPGNQVAGTIVYDLPAGVQPVEMELHDSMFSFGAKVRLQ